MESPKKIKRGGTSRRTRGKASPSSRLKAYRAKRDFRLTPEPSGSRIGRAGGGLVYSIQKHQATHLHYDLRLEEGGVLKSWAIPKEPPRLPGEKRLAVETEDHPLDYAFFQGRIPEGEYGAGSVAVWDRGTYEPIETKPGFRMVGLRGKKLKGTFVLVKLRPKPGDTGKNWLFLKTKGTGNHVMKKRKGG